MTIHDYYLIWCLDHLVSDSDELESVLPWNVLKGSVFRQAPTGDGDRGQLNTAGVVYTDDILARVIMMLKQLPDTSSMLFYISDHGESLGEQGLYLHGMPLAFAPVQQTTIPFLLWKNGQATESLELRRQNEYSQFNIFHSIMRAFARRCIQPAV